MAANQPHTRRDVGGDKSKSKDTAPKAPDKAGSGGKSQPARQSGGSKT
jgi:hypothetical protein